MPKNITLEEAHQLARKLYDDRKLQQSADVCAQILRQLPEDVTALCLLAIIFKTNQQPGMAMPYIDKVLAIDPSFADAHHEKALLLVATGKISEAANACERAIELDPSQFGYYNTKGHCLFKTGMAQEALSAFEKALELSPDNATIWCNIAAIHSYISAVNQWQNYLDNTLSNTLFEQPALQGHKADLLTSRAVIDWINGNKDACRTATKEAAQLLKGQEHYADYRYVNAYIVWLQALLKQHTHTADSTLSALHFVGDSHSIALAQSEVHWQDKPYRAQPHLIKGCKAWHLGSDQPNHYKLAFRRIIEHEVSKGQPMICVFGEIDCRVDEGIFSHCRKHNLDINSNIQELVEGYIAFIDNETKSKKITPAIWGIPAPLATQVEELAIEDQPAFVKMIATFNEMLGNVATQHGMGFIDVYALTAKKDGLADGKNHLDDAVHLHPKLYLKALKNKKKT